MKFYSIIFLLCAVIALYSPLSMADTDFGAKYAGEFMTLGADARASGMGEAQVAYIGGPASAYWNPASLGDIRGGGALLMHADRFGGVVKYDFISGVQRLSEKGVIGLTIFNLRIEDIPITTMSPDNFVEVKRWTSDMETAFIGSYSRRVSQRLLLGGNGKLLNKRVAGNYAVGIGFDLGARYDIGQWLKLGAKISDITSTFLAWDTGHKETILPSAAIGFLLITTLPSLEAEIRLAADAVFRGEDRGEADQFQFGALTADTHWGLEYIIKRTLSLRVGFDRDNLSAGAGIHLGPVDVDYAFQAHSSLGDSHRVSLALLWAGKPGIF